MSQHESAADIRNRRPSPAAPSMGAGPQPLGVPEDYRAPGKFGVKRGGGFGGRAPTSFGTQVAPQYMKGDEWQPSGLPPNMIAELQQDMVDAGLLRGKYRIGVWDPSSRSAYTTLLETANGAGVNAIDALQLWKDGLELEDPEEGRTRRAPLRIDQSNPDTLKKVFRKALRNELGYKVDDERLSKMVAAYHAAEAAPQAQRHAMGGDEFGDNQTGGTITDAIDPTTFAEQEAREIDPLKVDARKVVKQFDSLVGMLGTGGVLQVGGGAS